MRVVHVSTVHADTDTRIFEKQCRGLASLGYDVTLVIPSETSSERGGVRVLRLPRPRGRLARMTGSVLRAYGLLRRTPADIVHLHDPELLPLGLALRASGRTVVYDMHENVPQQIRAKYWIPRWLAAPAAAAVTLVERLCLNRMGVIMAEASYVEPYAWVKRRAVVQNFPLLDQITQRDELKHEVPTVGYIGSVTDVRGALTMVEAIRRVREAGRTVNLECIGETYPPVPSDPVYRQALAEGWLNAPGRLPPQEGWPRIARCHVGIAVLKNTPNYVKSFPTKMFEYMAMGLPVVVSDFPLYRGIVERHDCGICVDPSDVGAVAQAIRYLIEHPERARKMGENGSRAVQREYNWDTELSKLSDFYHSVVSNGFSRGASHDR